eukprot:1936226-Rhodomonas_salina.3
MMWQRMLSDSLSTGTGKGPGSASGPGDRLHLPLPSRRALLPLPLSLNRVSSHPLLHPRRAQMESKAGVHCTAARERRAAR